MFSCKEYFRGKKVTLMGVGLLGRGLGDAIFLAECGAELIITDLRDAKTLASSLLKLKNLPTYKHINFVLGEHRLDDFRNRDFILKAAGVSIDSLYIAEARKHGIPIEMDASLFAKLMPEGVTIIGVTGTRGKSTTTALIYELVKSFKLKVKSKNRVFKGGNLVAEATLPLLEKVKAGDIVVLELDSWQLQGFHDAKISPQVAVFTTFLDDHLVYYKGDRERYFEDKTAIFKYQKKNDTLVIGEQVSSRFNLKFGKKLNLKSRTVIARSIEVPCDWNILLIGEHNRENVACAIAAARVLGVSDAIIKKVVESFKPVAGRLEYLRTVRGVKIYNDNNATTPDATVAALKALRDLRFKKYDLRKEVSIHKSKIINHKFIILICGGTDKGLDMSKLVAEIPKHCKGMILLKESGTSKIRNMIYDLGFKNKIEVQEMETLKECMEEAMKITTKGDIVLFSPAFASFGRWFKNEYDRGEQFVRIVSSL